MHCWMRFIKRSPEAPIRRRSFPFVSIDETVYETACQRLLEQSRLVAELRALELQQPELGLQAAGA